MLITRRNFLIGTGGATATALILPKLILPEDVSLSGPGIPQDTLVSPMQGIIVDCGNVIEHRKIAHYDTPIRRRIDTGKFAEFNSEIQYDYTLEFVKVKFPEGHLKRIWCDMIEFKADKRRLNFFAKSRTGMFEVWQLPLAPYGNRVPNFQGLVTV